MAGEDLFEGLENSARIVAVFTGMRQQYIEAGWSKEGAEAMVLEAVRASGRNKS